MELHVNIGESHEILPLDNKTLINSPATHLHPEKTDIENECDADYSASSHFEIISDFKETHQNIWNAHWVAFLAHRLFNSTAHNIKMILQALGTTIPIRWSMNNIDYSVSMFLI